MTAAANACPMCNRAASEAGASAWCECGWMGPRGDLVAPLSEEAGQRAIANGRIALAVLAARDGEHEA